MSRLEIRPLRPEDDRSTLSSGDADLDRFFKKYAGQNQFRHHVGITYIALVGGSIAGFATVTSASLSMESLPKATRRSLPRYPLPVLRLARLAVDLRVRGQGIGHQLLKFVLILAVEMSERVGCVGVVVDAKENAKDFYLRYGFVPFDTVEGGLGDRPALTMMFLPLASIPR